MKQSRGNYKYVTAAYKFNPTSGISLMTFFNLLSVGWSLWGLFDDEKDEFKDNRSILAVRACVVYNRDKLVVQVVHVEVW